MFSERKKEASVLHTRESDSNFRSGRRKATCVDGSIQHHAGPIQYRAGRSIFRPKSVARRLARAIEFWLDPPPVVSIPRASSRTEQLIYVEEKKCSGDRTALVVATIPHEQRNRPNGSAQSLTQRHGSCSSARRYWRTTMAIQVQTLACKRTQNLRTRG
jgi:hypothetical protein